MVRSVLKPTATSSKWAAKKKLLKLPRMENMKYHKLYRKAWKQTEKTKLHSTQNNVHYRKDGIPFPKYINYHNIQLLWWHELQHTVIPYSLWRLQVCWAKPSYSKNIVMFMWTLVNSSSLKYIFQHRALHNAASFLGDWVTACVYLHIFKCFNIWQVSVTYTVLLSPISEKSHYFPLCCYHKNEMNIICTIKGSIKKMYMYSNIYHI